MYKADEENKWRKKKTENVQTNLVQNLAKSSSESFRFQNLIED